MGRLEQSGHWQEAHRSPGCWGLARSVPLGQAQGQAVGFRLVHIVSILKQELPETAGLGIEVRLGTKESPVTRGASPRAQPRNPVSGPGPLRADLRDGLTDPYRLPSGCWQRNLAALTPRIWMTPGFKALSSRRPVGAKHRHSEPAYAWEDPGACSSPHSLSGLRCAVPSTVPSSLISRWASVSWSSSV